MNKKPDVSATSLGNKRLWNTYMFWARSSLTVPLDSWWQIADPRNRIHTDRSQALQAIVFAALVLEYRIKATYEFVSASYDSGLTLGGLLNTFKTTIERALRFDNRQPIKLPREWARILPRL